MAKRKLIVIVDTGPLGDRIAEWQRCALETLGPDDDLVMLACTNTALPRRALRYPLYYALNLFTVRNALTRSVALGQLAAKVSDRIEFASGYDGAWQALPETVLARIAAHRPDAIIKLGMGLLRVPDELKVPILSWHHGDPEHFRGRPAGFWELLADSPVLGQMVQVIGNRLDAGQVVAFAETRVIRHSWKATLVEAFRHSHLLLAPALENAIAGRSLTKATTGRNYRLPGNLQVARLVVQLGAAKLGRIASGALREKRWRVSRAPVSSSGAAIALATGQQTLPEQAEWWTPNLPPGCSFIADPFFGSGQDELLVEAMPRWSGKGRIDLVTPTGSRQLSTGPGHHSYPGLVAQNGKTYCVPEIAQWSASAAFRWQVDWLRETELKFGGAHRLTDPTFVWHCQRLYLFANDARFGSGVLRLWSAAGLFDRFTEHPSSPIRISPRGARMGGNLLHEGDRLIRLGQDCARDYGDGLVAFEIEQLSPSTYRERKIGTMQFSDRKGPHTFNFAPDGTAVVFDWYREAITPMAGIRRLMARVRRG